MPAGRLLDIAQGALGRRFALHAVLAVVPTLSGCTTLTPPQLGPNEPRDTVFVLHSTFHSALALPDGGGGYVQWGFGDETYMSSGMLVDLFWGPCLFFWGLPFRTSGVLERRVLTGSSADTIAEETGMSVLAFDARDARVRELRERLETAHADGTPVDGGYDLHTNSLGYSFWWSNCQDGTATWARELEATVSSTAIRWGWWSLD